MPGPTPSPQPPRRSPRPGASSARRPRTGRRPGQNTSRQAILDAARAAFANRGYADSSLRGIAREAGVDPSLIVHFFESKAGLFGAVVEWPFEPEEHVAYVLAEGTEHLGERIARSFIAHWDRAEERSPMISLMAAACNDPTAAALLREFITHNFTVPVFEHIDADQPRLRAALLASQVGGFCMGLYVLRYDGIVDVPAEQLIPVLGQALQHTCTEPLPTTTPS